MSSHLECIGVTSEDEFAAVVQVAVQEGEPTPIDGGREILWRDAEGASIAVTVGLDEEILCVRPTFSAIPRVNARLGTLAEDAECPFCSRLLLEVVDEEGELVYPLAVELERHAPTRDPSAAGRQSRLAVSAFAETIESWPSEDAYEAANPAGIADDAEDPALASQSVIPTGLFVEPRRRFWQRKQVDAVPTAHALITGIVHDLEVRTNSLTGRDFAWLELETYGSSYDAVVAGTDASSDVSVGAVVQGEFWLIAGVADV